MPIPEGYEISKIEEEKSVDQGLVIYEKQVDWKEIEDISKTEEEKTKALVKIQSQYNQYVWVPVSESELGEIYGDEYGTGKLLGKPYTYNEDGRTALNWRIYKEKLSFVLGNVSKEPELNGANSDKRIDEMRLEKQLNMNREEINRELETMFYKTIKSIKKYGGFYIGRYENGYENEEMVIHKMNENLTQKQWGQLYTEAKELKKDNDSIYTNLIWGSLWDHTINWFVETNAKTYQEISDSTKFGNYWYSEFEYYADQNLNKATKKRKNGIIIPTGSSEYTKVNNIYDMAGNTRELTLENVNEEFNSRGGDYKRDQNCSCAERRETRINLKDESVGSRSMLFLR